MPSPKLTDFSLGLLAYEPAGDVIGWLPQPLTIQVASPYNALPTLIFSYPKTAPLADIFYNKPNGFEVALMIHTPHDNKWREPPNCRFMVLQWEDDVTDETNIMKFTCPGIAWNFSKQLVFKGKNDDALNAKEKLAAEKYEKGESDLRSKESALNSNLSIVKSDMKSKGNTYCLDIFPAKININGKWVLPKKNSILFNTVRRKFYRWNGAWYLITKKEVQDRAVDTYNKAMAVKSARTQYGHLKSSADWAKENAKEATKGGQRPMFKATAGWVIKRHWDEAIARGGNRLPGMGRSFNGTYATGKDGAGSKEKWRSRFDFDLTIGMSLLTILENLTEMGQIDWQMRRRQLDVALPGRFAKDVSDRVGLHLGKDLKEAPDKGTRHDYANYLLVRGESNLSFGMKNKNSDSTTGWGTWEKALSASGAKTVASAKEVVGQEAKLSQRRVKIESTRQIVVHPQAPYPLYDYLPGQFIRVYGADGAMQKVQVAQITLVQGEDGLVEGALVLGDRFRKGPLNFKRSLATTLGGYEKTIGGGTVPRLPDPIKGLPPRLVLPAMSLAVGARVAINESTGRSSVIVAMDWSPSGEVSFEPILPSEEPLDTTIDPNGYTPDY